jgi:hypothetical protein
MDCAICGKTISRLGLCNSCAADLIRRRNAYVYPAVHVAIQEGEGDEWIIPPRHSITFRSADNDRLSSSVALDQYHHALLCSPHWHGVVAGLASVVYWGFFSGADGVERDGRARARVMWFLRGRPGNVPLDVESAFLAVKAARTLAAKGQMGLALAEVSKLRELGQVSFASKVLTFLCPGRAGVFDSRIAERILRDPRLAHLTMNPNQGGVTNPKQLRYHAWCEHCTAVAGKLNRGIAAGKPWHWVDWDCSTPQWRAVDVERALFVQGRRPLRAMHQPTT